MLQQEVNSRVLEQAATRQERRRRKAIRYGKLLTRRSIDRWPLFGSMIVEFIAQSANIADPERQRLGKRAHGSFMGE